MASFLFLILSTIVISNVHAMHPTYGNSANEGAFKYAAAIYKNSIFSCNGVIINSGYILTAGHCVCNRTADILRVIVGVVRVTDANAVKWREVGNTHCYDTFRKLGPGIHENDIGLLKLKVPLVLGGNIQAIELAIEWDGCRQFDCNFVIFREHEKYYKTENSLHIMDLSLRWSPVKVLRHPECRTIHDVSRNVRCALHSNQSESRNRPGDSGAPVVCDNKVLGILIGTLFKNNLSANGAAIISVTPYLNWIANIVDPPK